MSAIVATLGLAVGEMSVARPGIAESPGDRASATYNLRAPPSASFRWFPAFPRVGERFTLVSTATDPASPIVAFAWDAADDGPFGTFVAGGSVATAMFATPA